MFPDDSSPGVTSLGGDVSFLSVEAAFFSVSPLGYVL